MIAPADTDREPVDAVYCWVDGSSERFAQELRSAVAQAGGATADASARRFRDNGELRYSLRSLARFVPWVRTVHVVTNGDVPRWLNRNHERLRLVRHDTIFRDPGNLPTFNSNAIEMHLHRIPGLSRHFLYLNDDCFFGRPIRRDDFRGERRDVFFLDGRPCPTATESGSVHDRSCAHTARCLALETGRQPVSLLPAHTPQLYDSAVLSGLEQQFEAEFRRCSAHRLRSPTDFKLRIAYASLAVGGQCSVRVLEWGSSDYSFLSLEARPLHVLRQLLSIGYRRPRFFCLNDDLGSVSRHHVVLQLERLFLRTYFPHVSPFETPRRKWRGGSR